MAGYIVYVTYSSTYTVKVDAEPTDDLLDSHLEQIAQLGRDIAISYREGPKSVTEEVDESSEIVSVSVFADPGGDGDLGAPLYEE